MSFRLLLVAPCLALLPLASPATVTNRCVSTAKDMLGACNGAPSDSWTFALTGTVTWCDGPNLVLKDATGNCNLFNVTDDTLRRGDRIAATGQAHVNASREPWIDRISTVRLGFTQLPQPERKSLKDCLESTPAFEGVRVEATVVDVTTDELDARYDWLILKDGSILIAAVCRRTPHNKQLIDAQVEVTGPVWPHVLGMRKFVSPFINTELGGNIRILSPPADDPFSFPPVSPSRFDTPAGIEQLGKHTAVGKIVATWPADNCLLLTPDGRHIRLVLAANETLPPCGQLVRAVGYPSSDLFTLWLTRAKVRPEDMPGISEAPPKDVAAEQLLPYDRNWRDRDSNLNNRLVTLQGLLKSLERHNDGTRLAFLDCDGRTIPVDYSSHPGNFDGIDVGSEIEVVGRCILLNERWNPNNVFPRITGLLIVLSEKPTVVHGPGWWSTGRLLAVIALLVVALVCVYLRSFIAKRVARIKLKERTQLAVEIHDSLSQALTGLACQITAAQDSIEMDMPVTKQKLMTANQMLMSCRTELRNCLFDLRNDTIGEKNLGTAILRTLEPFEDNATILVRFNVNRSHIEDSNVHAILAVIRELVSNAVRHGNAWTIKVAGVRDGISLLFSVTDDGTGFDPEHCKGSDDGHFGLDGIRERLARLDGSISFETPRCGGTRAVIRMPLHPTRS